VRSVGGFSRSLTGGWLFSREISVVTGGKSRDGAYAVPARGCFREEHKYKYLGMLILVRIMEIQYVV